MISRRSATSGRSLFGVPAVLASSEATSLMRDLTQLWRLTYEKSPADLTDDLRECRKFFDPLTRGQTLRDRLSGLPPTPQNLMHTLRPLGSPLVLEAGEETLIVGVEGRLLLSLLSEGDMAEGFLVLSPESVADAEHRALDSYREWSQGRLSQVIDLRTGRGREVMQGIAVGLTIALLVNRSDAPERALKQWSHASPDGVRVDRAIYQGAERFAEAISGGRGNRSSGEQRLKGGYALTEARRRLAHRIEVVRGTRGTAALVYIPGEYRGEVIEYLGRDLARRQSLTEAALASAFDRLVVAFRSGTAELSHRSIAFERPADTRTLRADLIGAFERARTENSTKPHELTERVSDDGVT